MNEVTATIVEFIKQHKHYFDIAQAMSSVFNLLGWTLGVFLLIRAVRSNKLNTVAVGPLVFQIRKEEAIEATAAAVRSWSPSGSSSTVDIARLRASVGRAFTPETSDRMMGRSILWVDDNSANNELAVRALRKFQLDIEQQDSTLAGLAALKRRPFDLVISDMGRGTNMQAGYEFLDAMRSQGYMQPFFIFAGADKPEFRKEAAARGAQLSTNDMLELTDTIITTLCAHA